MLLLLAVSLLALLGMLSSQALAGGLGGAVRLQTTSPGETTSPTPDPAPPPKPASKPASKPRASTPASRSAPAPRRQATPSPQVTYSTPSRTSSPAAEEPAESRKPDVKPSRKRTHPKPRANPTPLTPVIALHRLRESQPDRGAALGVAVALRSPLSVIADEPRASSNGVAWIALLSMPLGVGLILLLGAMTPAPILLRSAHLRGLTTRRTDLAAYGIGITVTILVAYLIAGLGQ